MNMAGVVHGPKRATDMPAAASPAARLAAMRGEDRRGSRPIDTRNAPAGTPFASASHSAETSGHEGGQEGHAVSQALRSRVRQPGREAGASTSHPKPAHPCMQQPPRASG